MRGMIALFTCSTVNASPRLNPSPREGLGAYSAISTAPRNGFHAISDAHDRGSRDGASGAIDHDCKSSVIDSMLMIIS